MIPWVIILRHLLQTVQQIAFLLSLSVKNLHSNPLFSYSKMSCFPGIPPISSKSTVYFKIQSPHCLLYLYWIPLFTLIHKTVNLFDQIFAPKFTKPSLKVSSKMDLKLIFYCFEDFEEPNFPNFHLISIAFRQKFLFHFSCSFVKVCFARADLKLLSIHFWSPKVLYFVLYATFVTAPTTSASHQQLSSLYEHYQWDP